MTNIIFPAYPAANTQLNPYFPPQNYLEDIGQKLISPFVALDFAKDQENKWWLIEVNDGGASGLPEHMDYDEFYNQLFRSTQ